MMVTGIKCRSLCWAHHHIQSEFYIPQTSLTKTWRCLGAIISLHASGYGHDRVQQGLIIMHIPSIQEWWLWLGLSISLQFFRGRCWIRQGLRPKDWNEWSIRYIMSFNRFALTSLKRVMMNSWTFGSSLESSLRGIIREEGWGPTATST